MSQNSKKIIMLIRTLVVIPLAFTCFNQVSASQITVDKVVNLVNESRMEKGLPKLELNETLNKVAQDKLNDMADHNYFAHNSPAGVSPWFWFEKNGYNYQYAGENLAINFLEAEAQHKAWMKSPTHRKNILNDKYEEIGVAVAAAEINGQLSIVSVQEFGTLLNASALPGQKKGEAAADRGLVTDKNNNILPQVLSVKDITKNNDQLPIYRNEKITPMQDQFPVRLTQDQTINLIQISALVIFALSLSAMPLSFLLARWRFIPISHRTKQLEYLKREQYPKMMIHHQS